MLIAKTSDRVLALFALAVILHSSAASAIAAETELRVPEDSSLSLSEYTELGVPEPSQPWISSDYERALRILVGVPRTQRPRAAGPSRLLFDRLVLSYRLGFELPGGSDPEDGAKTPPPQDLPELYSARKEDGLLFDKELIAIRAESLSRTLGTLPNRAKLLAQAEGFASMMKTRTSEAERERFSEAMRRAEEAAERVSDLVKSQTSELLVLASIPQVTDPARQLLLHKAQDLVPKLPAFLDDQDSRWVATLLRAGGSSSEANTSIASGLFDLAKELEVASENTSAR